MKPEKTLVCAYYFPNWHPNPQNDKWHGKNWTEWEVLKYARPRFPGHKQPKIPLWGYEDESEPDIMEKKIKTASSQGIDGFVFDWYWYEDIPYRNQCLEKGFLNSVGNSDFKFSLMWCNHDAKQVHPGSRMFPAPSLSSGDVSPETFLKATDYCIKHYFSHPNYLRINGGLYFSIYHLHGMVESLGGLDVACKCFTDFRQRVIRAGLGEMHLNAVGMESLHNQAILADTGQGCSPSVNQPPQSVNFMLDKLGIDSRSGHGWNKQKHADTFPGYDYLKFALKNIAEYEHFTSCLKLPYNPAVCTGWDVSPRAIPSEVYDNIGYPFTVILTENTPENFAAALKKAKEFILSDQFTGNMLLINSWNEWTEGTYLEPDTEYKYGYLEAVRELFG